MRASATSCSSGRRRARRAPRRREGARAHGGGRARVERTAPDDRTARPCGAGRPIGSLVDRVVGWLAVLLLDLRVGARDDHELDAAVGGAALAGLAAVDRLLLAVPDRGQAGGVDALAHD